MSFPNSAKDLSTPVVLSPEDMISYRRSLGRFPRVDPPEGMVLCLQRGLPERSRRRYPLRHVGRLMGDLYLLKRSNGKVGVATNFGIGAPSIAALAEELIAWGVKRLVSISWAGGLQAYLSPGSIVVCQKAIRDEGTSHHYLPATKFVTADVELSKSLLEVISSQDDACMHGITWTTDAPYRETREEVRQYQAEGVKTVEMESAALLAIGQARGIACASICVVGDSLADLTWRAPANVQPVDQALSLAYAAAISTLNDIRDK